MSENDVRDGLREAVAGEPPLDFDPDALVDTARQQVRRRALLSVGVATVAVVAAAVVVPLALSGGGEGGGAPVADRPTATSQSDPGTPTTAPQAIDWPPPGTEPVTYTAAELQGRANEMRSHLQEVLPTLLPDATDIDVGFFGGEAEGAVADDQNYLNAFATFTVDGARYGIAVNVFAPGMNSQSPAELCEGSTCIQQGAADDGYVVTTAEDLGEAKIVSAHHFRDSGGSVFVSGYNYDPTSQTAPVYHPSLPVGAELLGQLATDPRFDL